MKEHLAVDARVEEVLRIGTEFEVVAIIVLILF